MAANEALQREVRELTVERDHLRSQLREIGDALGRLTGGQRRGRGAAGSAAPVAEAPARRQRKPITDPEQLERRRQALTKARAARAEKLAAARASSAGSSDS